MSEFIKSFADISIHDLPLVGGKNASLGEMFAQLNPKGISVPDGFAVTAEAYRHFLKENQLEAPLNTLMGKLDKKQFSRNALPAR
jgi:pyruvate,water dikinase